MGEDGKKVSLLGCISTLLEMTQMSGRCDGPLSESEKQMYKHIMDRVRQVTFFMS